MNVLLLTLIAVLAAPTQLYAFYLDPVTGSMVIQVTIAALLSGAAVIKMYWKKIVDVIGKRKS